jgi:hypothetical protein
VSDTPEKGPEGPPSLEDSIRAALATFELTDSRVILRSLVIRLTVLEHMVKVMPWMLTESATDFYDASTQITKDFYEQLRRSGVPNANPVLVH